MNHLEEAKKQLELLAGQSTRTSGLMMKDVILFNALIAIAEQLEKMNDMEWMGSREFVIKWYKEDK